MSIKKQAISGVKWTSSSSFFSMGAQLIKISVLTRFLEKSDFGLVAIVGIILGFTNLFVDMGISSAILHKQNISKNEYNSLYWFNIFFSLLLYVLIFFSAPYIADFYKQDLLKILIPLMGLTIILSALGRQFKVIEQKNLNFKLISIVNIISLMISISVAIILAIKGYKVFSLVYSALATQIFTNFFFLSRAILQRRIQFHFYLPETKPFLKIGIYQVGGQIINYFNRDLDVLIIGKFFGAEILGGYDLAKKLTVRPIQMINPILSKVGAPVLAKFNTDKEKLKLNYLKLVKTISSLNFLIYLLVFIFAPYIVSILYGNKYLDITILVRILSIYMFLRSIANPIGSLVIATGRTDLEFYWNLFSFIITPIVLIIASTYSIKVVALSLVLLMILYQYPFWAFIIKKTLKISFMEYMKSIMPSFKYIFKLIKKFT